MAGWNLWHGCRKVSEGCRRCYVYRQDARWEQDASQVRRTAAFDLPVRRDRTGRYKIPPGQTVYTCFTSDFFIEEADAWRGEAWAMIRERSDCTFLMITVMMPKVVGVVLDQMTRIVRFWSFAFLNNSIIAVQEKIPLYKVLKMLFRESAMDS